jgi:hypothetical protein
MHKGIIMLTKVDSQEKAKEKVESYLKDYEGDVWDWYVIGGRWSGLLIKYREEFYKLVKKKKIKVDYYSDIEKEETQKQLQDIWEKDLKQKSLNPMMRDSFLVYGGRNLYAGQKYYTDNEYIDDIMPLTDCIDIVREYAGDYIKKGKKELRRAKEWLKVNERRKEPDYNMYGYSLKCASNIFSQKFSFEANIYNIESYRDAYKIPKDIENYYAVVIDIHN